MGNVKEFDFRSKGASAQNSAKQPIAQAMEHGAEVQEAHSNILDMGAFRTRKNLSADRKTNIGEAFRGLSSNVSGRNEYVNDKSADLPNPHDDELAARIERIKGSIQRINQLMAELKGIPPESSRKD